MDEDQDYPLLAYMERLGDQAWCVWKCEVDRALQWPHDCYGHYSVDLTIKRLMGHYFWPTRHQDAVRYCRSCPSCQLTARPTPSQVPTSIIQVFFFFFFCLLILAFDLSRSWRRTFLTVSSPLSALGRHAASFPLPSAQACPKRESVNQGKNKRTKERAKGQKREQRKSATRPPSPRLPSP